MEKFLRLFCLLLFFCGMSLSLRGNDGKIVVWFHDGNNIVLHINETPEFQYTDDSVVFYSGNTTYKWPLEIVQKLTFENVEPISWTVDALSSNVDMGTVTGNGLIEDGESVSLTAVPCEGYVFVRWSDGTTDNPYTFTPTGNVELTALFKVNAYAVIYMVKDEEWARDSLDYGTTIVKREYTALEGETFNGWLSNANYVTMPAHDVVYTADITSGITTTTLPAKSEVDVYTLQGRLAARRLSVTQICKILPRGVYIIDGAKEVVR